MHKIIATYLDRPHLVTALAWASWLLNVLITWASSGEVLTAATFGHALLAALVTKRPGDLARPAIASRVAQARLDGARGARISSTPPMPLNWDSVPELELPDEVTPRRRGTR